MISAQEGLNPLSPAGRSSPPMAAAEGICTRIPKPFRNLTPYLTQKGTGLLQPSLHQGFRLVTISWRTQAKPLTAVAPSILHLAPEPEDSKLKFSNRWNQGQGRRERSMGPKVKAAIRFLKDGGCGASWGLRSPSADHGDLGYIHSHGVGVRICLIAKGRC